MEPRDDAGPTGTLGSLTVDGGVLAFGDFPPSGAPSDPRRAVVIVHDAAGASHHFDGVAQRFAALGYRALTPHLYHRTGDPALSYADVDGMVRHMKALNEHDLLADLGALVAHLNAAGFDDRSIGLVGFCMGGTVALLGACRLPLGAAVTFYGGGIVTADFGIPPLLDLAPELKTPWLGLYADHDPLAPVPEVEQLRSAVARSSLPTTLRRYAEAGHGFHSDWRPQNYHEASARDAWDRTVEWLDRHLVAAPDTPRG